jgi:hypothetical protein
MTSITLGGAVAIVLAVFSWPLVRGTVQHYSPVAALSLIGLLAMACGFLAFVGQAALSLVFAFTGVASVGFVWHWTPEASMLALWTAILWCTLHWETFGDNRSDVQAASARLETR